MMTSPPAAHQRANPLARLFWLRNFTLLGLLLLMLWSNFGVGVHLPWLAMGITLALLAGLNVFTALRLKQPAPVRAPEILMHLLTDLGGLTVLLLYTGGWANPFVSLLLLPVVMAALLLPARMAWLAGGLAIAAYTLVAYVNIPLDIPPDKAFYLHVSGMWFNFAASVGVVVFFVLRLRDQLRQQEAELAAAREATLRNEQVVAVALVAAGTAHELATPLNTLAVLNESLLAQDNQQDRESLELMQTQIERCRNLLKDLSRTAQAGTPGKRIAASAYLTRLADEWRLLRPAVQVDIDWHATQTDPDIIPPASLDQALINLLNNAADASAERVFIEGKMTSEGLQIDILDHGTGPAPALNALAQPGHSTKNGLGIGLFLSNASIEHLGGQVSLSERAGGGSCVSVWLPLKGLQA
jgi:two-component system sensor histidine kinase RegB